jgi:hypothetical protein
MMGRLLRDMAFTTVGALICLAFVACQTVGTGSLSGGGDTDSGANTSGDGTGDGTGDGGADTTATCPDNPLVTALTIYANYDNGVRIGVGESITLKAVVTYSDDTAEAATVCWASSDEAKATVTADGVGQCTLRGVAVGQATVTASVGSVDSDPLLIKVQAGGLIPGTP